MKKWNLFQSYELVGIMQWLNEQSLNGWELKEWGSFFVKFEESKEGNYQYQIDMDNWENGANTEREAQLRALGWEYVDTIGGTRYHIYRSKELKASIPINEEYLAFHCKKLRMNPILWILGGFITLNALLIPLIGSIPYTLIELTRTDRLAGMLWLILGVLLAVTYVKTTVHQWRLLQYFDKIKKIPVYEAVCQEKFQEKSLMPRILWWSIFLIGIILLFRIDRVQDERNLEDAKEGTVFVDLMDLQEKEFKISKTTWPWEDAPDINRANFIEYTSGLFVDEYYEVYQSGYGKSGNRAYMEGYYWNGVKEHMQEKLFTQIAERYTSYHYMYELWHRKDYDTSEYWIFLDQTDESFDRLMIAVGKDKFLGSKLIFAQKGSDIFYLKYDGDVDISVLIKVIKQVF